MSPSNLGIVFGPSLMRPRPTGATISLSSLVDYPHQARIIEAFIVFYSYIFQSKSSQFQNMSRTTSTSIQQVYSTLRFSVVFMECMCERMGFFFLILSLTSKEPTD